MYDSQAIPKALLSCGWKTVQFIKAIGTLKNFSLVTAHKGSQDVSTEETETLYDIHRLVQLASRTWLKLSDAYTTSWGESVSLLKNRLLETLEISTLENLQAQRKIIPHATHVLSPGQVPVAISSIFSLAEVTRDFVEAAMLHELVAVILKRNGKYHDALSMARKSLSMLKIALPVIEELYCLAMATVASCLYGVGQLVEAEELCQEFIEIQRKLLGLAHPSTKQTMNLLSIIYRRTGRQLKGFELLQILVRLDDKSEFRDLVSDAVRCNTAADLIERGNLEEATNILEDFVREYRETPERLPYILAPIYNLAQIYYILGRDDDAQTLANEGLKIGNKTMGKHHPHTLKCWDVLASIADKHCDTKEVVRIRSVQLDLTELPADHPHVCFWQESLMQNLDAEARTWEDEAEALDKYEQFAEAEMLWRKLLDHRRSTIGPKHRLTLRAMNRVALSCGCQSRWKEAEELLVSILELCDLPEEEAHVKVWRQNLRSCRKSIQESEAIEQASTVNVLAGE